MQLRVGQLPDGKEPVSEIWDRKAKRFQRKQDRRRAEKWLPIYINEHQGLPFGVQWFGDIHADDDGCNVPLLKRDLELCGKTDGLFGAHIGDATNNWIGSLNRLHGQQSTTVRDGRRLVTDILHGHDIEWLLWLTGNHDEWNEGGEILNLLIDNTLYLADWSAKICIHAADQQFKVHAAHAFAGKSMWNPTHGPQRAARLISDAELYVAGHIHTPGSQGFEIPETGRYPRAVQCRGYKWFDSHAERLGFPENQCGASVMTIFHPQAETPAGRISVFEDVALGVEVLTALRDRAQRRNAPPVPKRAKPVRKQGKQKRQSRPRVRQVAA